MTADSVVELQELFNALGIIVWLDGGWAIDAVIGEQTRPHEDLDILVSLADVATLKQALVARGFEEQRGGREANFVLVDRAGRKIDIHVITLAPSGDGSYAMEDGSTWVFKRQSLAGRGTIRGIDVQCLTAEEQIRCHNQGYEPREKDLADMALLGDRLGVQIPPRLRQVEGRRNR